MASADDDQQISAHDPALYEEIARTRPERVRAVLLRDTTGGAARVERFGEVPVVYGRDGDAIAAVLPVD
jgi:phosphatidate phosphatase APP1